VFVFVLYRYWYWSNDIGIGYKYLGAEGLMPVNLLVEIIIRKNGTS
jgi:hypothetical protein